MQNWCEPIQFGMLRCCVALNFVAITKKKWLLILATLKVMIYCIQQCHKGVKLYHAVWHIIYHSECPLSISISIYYSTVERPSLHIAYFMFIHTYRLYSYTYRVSQKECARLRKSVPYVKLYRYNPKHLCPKLNGYGDNGQRKVWSSLVSTHCTPSVTSYLSNAPARQLDIVMEWPWRVRYSAR